ncbi:MAG: RNA methyltransferase [Baekduia sp.]
MISSTTNPLLKEIRRIQARKVPGRFVAEGEDLLAEAAAQGWRPQHLLRAGIEIDAGTLAKVSGLASGTRQLGVFEERWTEPTGPVSVALWGIKDPGNVGTVIRSALAFGATSVVIGPETTDPYGPKAVRASMGAIFAVDVARASAIDQLAGTTIGLDAHADTDLGTALPASDITFVVGAERAGLPPATAAACDELRRIPIASESLNAAMAATVALYEVSSRVREA